MIGFSAFANTVGLLLPQVIKMVFSERRMPVPVRPLTNEICIVKARGGARVVPGGHCPPKFCLAPPVALPNFPRDVMPLK